jgi:hypothetical protein
MSVTENTSFINALVYLCGRVEESPVEERQVTSRCRWGTVEEGQPWRCIRTEEG